MRKLALILTAAAVLAGCSWETYTNESGRTAVRQNICYRHTYRLSGRYLF